VEGQEDLLVVLKPHLQSMQQQKLERQCARPRVRSKYTYLEFEWNALVSRIRIYDPSMLRSTKEKKYGKVLTRFVTYISLGEEQVCTTQYERT
jgi:hypothetical protein